MRTMGFRERQRSLAVEIVCDLLNHHAGVRNVRLNKSAARMLWQTQARA